MVLPGRLAAHWWLLTVPLSHALIASFLPRLSHWRRTRRLPRGRLSVEWRRQYDIESAKRGDESSNPMRGW